MSLCRKLKVLVGDPIVKVPVAASLTFEIVTLYDVEFAWPVVVMVAIKVLEL